MDPPAISPATAALLSTAYTASYLSSIYVFQNLQPRPHSTRTERTRDRNDPSVIKARLLGVTSSTVLSCASLWLLLPSSPSSSTGSGSGLVVLAGPTKISFAPLLPPLLLLSEPWKCLKLVGLPLALTASLFSGSLYVAGLRGTLPGQSFGGFKSLSRELGGWQGVRNYVFAPVTEEVVFRGCIIAVSALAGWNKTQLVFLTPLYFGLAHVHHAWETFVAGGRTREALLQGVLQSTFQFAYTTLFGWYESFIYLRTGSIIPPILIHSFCNLMGLPPIGWALQVFPDKKLSICTTYLAGIATFIYGFWKWTEPSLYA